MFSRASAAQERTLFTFACIFFTVTSPWVVHYCYHFQFWQQLMRPGSWFFWCALTTVGGNHDSAICLCLHIMLLFKFIREKSGILFVLLYIDEVSGINYDSWMFQDIDIRVSWTTCKEKKKNSDQGLFLCLWNACFLRDVYLNCISHVLTQTFIDI